MSKKKTEDSNTLYTSKDAAATVGCTKRTIHKNAAKRMIGKRIGSQLVFTADDILKLIDVIQPRPGRPPKER